MKAPFWGLLCLLAEKRDEEMTEEIRWIGGAMQSVPRRVREAILPIISDFELRLVGVELAHEGRRTILWVYIDGEAGATIEDCARLTPELSAVLDVVDPVVETYELRVSTPGLDRPLMTADDFVEFAGQEAQIVLATPVGGRRKFTGIVGGYENEEVSVECSDGSHQIPIDYIQRARLRYEIEIGKKRRP
jgi:ribosome maturation factor RimP